MFLIALALMIAAHGLMGWLGARFFSRAGGAAQIRFRLLGSYALGLSLWALVAAVRQPAVWWWCAIAVPTYTLAIVLMLTAKAAHAARAPDYIGSANVPAALVVSGPYRWVRHPFYSAYLLVLTASVGMAGPSWPVVAATAGLVAVFVWGAKREEAQLLASALGPQYRGWQERTGMFVPRLIRPACRASADRNAPCRG